MFSLLIHCLSSLLATPAKADLLGAAIPGCNFVSGQFGGLCIPKFIAYVITWILGFVGSLCLIYIIIGGFQIALGSAVGDKEAGKSRVIWALVGLLVCLFSFAILKFVFTSLGA